MRISLFAVGQMCTDQTFKDFNQLVHEANRFKHFHNHNHRYSSQDNKTPEEYRKEDPLYDRLPEDFDLTQKPPLDSGSLVFVRFIRSDLKVNILGTEFTVKNQLAYSYIVAEIIIENHVLLIKQDDFIHHIFPFLMPVDW